MVHGHNPTGSTENMPAAIKIVNDLKKHNKDIQIAIGGGHVSTLPKNTRGVRGRLLNTGRGLYTIKGLHDYLNGKLSIKKIPGLWYRSNDDIVKTFNENVRNLDEDMGNYAFDLLPGLETIEHQKFTVCKNLRKVKMKITALMMSEVHTFYLHNMVALTNVIFV